MEYTYYKTQCTSTKLFPQDQVEEVFNTWNMLFGKIIPPKGEMYMFLGFIGKDMNGKYGQRHNNGYIQHGF